MSSSATATTTPAVKRIAIKSTDWENKLSNVAIDRGHLNRLVMDYLVVEGYKEAAQNFARESGMMATTSAAQEAEFESIQNRMTIRQAIQQGNIVEAIERVNDLNPEILDKDPSLYFHLQQQRLIELIRQKKIDEALLFAQHELAPRGEEHPEFLNELEQTMTLLAYDVNLPALEAAAAAAAARPASAPARPGEAEAAANSGQGEGESAGAGDGAPPFVAALLHPSHRQATAAQVNAAILTAQSHGPTPKLPNLLRMLAWGETLLGERADFPKLDMHMNGTGGTEKQAEKDGEKSGPTVMAAAGEDVAMVL